MCRSYRLVEKIQWIEGSSIDEGSAGKAVSFLLVEIGLAWASTFSLVGTDVRAVVIGGFTCGRWRERTEGAFRESLLSTDKREDAREETLCNDIAGSECAYGRWGPSSWPCRADLGDRYSELGLDKDKLRCGLGSITLGRTGLSGRTDMFGGTWL